MGELKLVGLHEDGEHVVLEGTDGQRFRLVIDEALRAAVRRDRPQLEQVRAGLVGGLPPREIQARIRAGARAEDVAADAGMPVQLVRRYEGPVLAEREFVAGQAQGTRVGHDVGAPVLGELVTDRLATRGVDPAHISWDAFRHGTGAWTVQVGFTIGDATRSARWSYDATARTVRAQDDEARWLSETELSDGPIPRRHLSSVQAGTAPGVTADAALRPLLAAVDLPPTPEEPEPDPHAETHALLDDLIDRRGVRQQLAEEDEDDERFEGFGPQHAFDFDNPDLTEVPAAHPPRSRPEEAVDAEVLAMPALGGPWPSHAADTEDTDGGEPSEQHGDPPATPAGSDAPTDDEGAAPAAPAQSRTKPRRGRASIPSWDEIVFGAKSE